MPFSESFTSATSSPKSCICIVSLNLSLKLPASLGERFWSNSSFIRHKVQSSLYWQQNLNMQECPLSEGKENPQAPHQNSFLKPGIRALHIQLSVDPLCMASLHVYRIQWLFYQLIAYLSVYMTKIRNNKDTFQI
jgi:hypothetical protein